MVIIGLDPGSKESAFIRWDFDKQGLLTKELWDNPRLLNLLRQGIYKSESLAIEQIRGYGIVAGDDTFDTCQWSGRFQEAHEGKGGIVEMIPRKVIKKCLCGNTTTNDKYIRMALIERLGEVGTKSKPGPLYGISGHMWAALASAVTYKELQK